MSDPTRDRLCTAYATATKASHEGGRVELHLGADVIAYLKALCTVPDPGIVQTRCWGFPVVEVPGVPDHISVHTVQTIF